MLVEAILWRWYARFSFKASLCKLHLGRCLISSINRLSQFTPIASVSVATLAFIIKHLSHICGSKALPFDTEWVIYSFE